MSPQAATLDKGESGKKENSDIFSKSPQIIFFSCKASSTCKYCTKRLKIFFLSFLRIGDSSSPPPPLHKYSWDGGRGGGEGGEGSLTSQWVQLPLSPNFGRGGGREKERR